MKIRYFDIGDEDWSVLICFDLKILDEYQMRSYMMSFGLRGHELDKAIDILLLQKNTGMSISSLRKRMSIIFIGNATDESQWWDTVDHELYHVQQAILDYYSVPPDSEAGAWTMGYMMRKTVQQIAEPCK